MQSFQEFISEEPIRLKGFSRHPDSQGYKAPDNSDKFIKDLHDSSTEHFSNHRARVIGKAHVFVSKMHNGIHIHDIQSHHKGSGAGTHALKHLTGLADKHGVHLHLYAKGYGETKTSQLRDWYKKHGFKRSKHDASEMNRSPT